MSSTAVPCAANTTPVAPAASTTGRGLVTAPCVHQTSDTACLGHTPPHSTAITPASPPADSAHASPSPSPCASGASPGCDTASCEGAADELREGPGGAPEAEVRASLLLKPFAKTPENPALDASAIMATPQSMQSMQDGGAHISPFEMLLAALDPRRQPPLPPRPYTDVTSPATAMLDCHQRLAMASAAGCSQGAASGMAADRGDMSAAPGQLGALSSGLWSPGIAVPGDQCASGISGMAWAAARQASEATALSSYQFGQPPGGNQFVASEPTRVEPFPLGAKRPYGDLGPLLSSAATDVYAGEGATGELASQMPVKKARHSMDPVATDPTSVAAAAAIAAAVLSHGSTLPNPTRRATIVGTCMPPGTGVQVPHPNACFDQLGQGPGLPLDAGLPLMPGAPLSQVSVGHTLNPYPAQHMRSLSLSHLDSPMGPGAALSAAGPYPALGYFYEGLGMGMLGPDGHEELAALSAPIPAIPGVTASPKVKLRRISVPDMPPLDADDRAGPKTRPRRQKVRFSEDLYTPTWVRNCGQKKEGFCDTCSPGKWLQLKNSAFWYHKQFSHGISSVSGRPFARPLQVRHFDADSLEGLCHQCRKWVPIANAKRRNSVLWFRHAHKCHVYNKPKQDLDFCDISAMESAPAVAMEL